MRVFKTEKGTELLIITLKGKEYLEVKFRLVWFREDHPLWSIETSYVEMSEKHALACAIIRDENSRLIAMAHKREDKDGFPDFHEKAETGAIGRALALIGYGTQFCADELDEGERIVDSPVAKPVPVTTPKAVPVAQGVPQREDYVITFGKHKGKHLSTMGADVARSYVKWLEDSAAKDGKPLSAGAAEFKAAVENFYPAK
jgi:hypothetical protein